MKSIKKVIALLLTMLLVLSVSPVAFAEGEEEAEVKWFTSYGIEKGSGTLAEAVASGIPGAKISLLKDITALDEVITFSKDTVLIGNGYTITRGDTNANAMFIVDHTASLTLTDITINGNAENFPGYTKSIINVVSGQVILNDGAVLTSNNARNSEGGAVSAGSNQVSIAQDCDVIMNSGSKITDCTANTAGAVYLNNKAEMTMNGGVIENCKAAYDGGAVVVSKDTSMLTIKSGKITGCSASLANTGYAGSAIYAPKGTVVLEDAEITGNTNMSDKGAVYFSSAASFTVGGNVYVYDNDGSAAQSNIYIPEHAVIAVSPEFADNAKIGVTAPSYFGSTDTVDASFIELDDIMGYVYNDADGTTFINSNGVVSLIECIRVTFDPGNGECDVASKVYAVDLDFGYLPECAPREGFEFLGWYTATDSLVTESTAVSYYEDITLYAKWENLNKLDNSPFGVIGRFFERIGDLMRMVFEFLESLFTGTGNKDLEELK